jgi:hypothetical protein
MNADDDVRPGVDQAEEPRQDEKLRQDDGPRQANGAGELPGSLTGPATPAGASPKPKTRTIRQLLERVFPQGTNWEYPDEDRIPPGADPLKDAPKWAPDLFAAMAILIEQSGCYTHRKFIQQHPPADSSESEADNARSERLARIKHAARGYRFCWRINPQECPASSKTDTPQCSYRGQGAVASQPCGEHDGKDDATTCGWQQWYGQIQGWWEDLVSPGKHGSKTIGVVGDLRGDEPPAWCDEAMMLFEIADEACEGVGFISDMCGINHVHDDNCLSPMNPIAIHVCRNQRLAYKEEHDQRGQRIDKIEQIEGDYEAVRDKLTKGIEELEGQIQKQQFTRLPYLPYSICYAVPSYIACVQPKANTPQVGYSLRSFSHNLALLPRVGEVSTYWFNAFGSRPGGTDEPLNLLLIPYPYFIGGECFDPCASKNREHHYKFRVEQKWLKDLLTPEDKGLLSTIEKAEKARRPYARDKDGDQDLNIKWRRAELQGMRIKNGIEQLVTRAADNVETIHGVILPELALTFEVAEYTSKSLFDQFPNLQFFISGVIADRTVSGDGDPRPINSVFTRLNITWPVGIKGDAPGPIPLRRIQVKHHRWMLERSQIVRYHLGAQLDPEAKWWEDNDMIERENLFWVFRPYMVMSNLVCEDLARIDPVQQVLRAVAPNLVIALLMDGPQTKTRWACRYATGLSDDPGCGVLTLTSLGMIRRDDLAERKDHKIAIWRDSEGQTRELTLPPGAAALAVTLSVKRVQEMAAGGRKRSVENRSRKLFLSAVHPIPTPKAGDMAMFSDVDRTI